jgi:hypothetical protein
MIIVVRIFRKCELINSIVLLIINIITKILFERLILTLDLFVSLRVKCDAIAQRKLQMIAERKLILRREKIFSIDYDNLENFAFSKKFFYQCVS